MMKAWAHVVAVILIIPAAVHSDEISEEHYLLSSIGSYHAQLCIGETPEATTFVFHEDAEGGIKILTHSSAVTHRDGAVITAMIGSDFLRFTNDSLLYLRGENIQKYDCTRFEIDITSITKLDLSALANSKLLADLLRTEAQLAAALADAESNEEALREQLKAALAAQLAAEQDLSEALSEEEQRQALLAAAQRELSAQEEISADSQREVAVLNKQVTALRTQLDDLQGLLDLANEMDAASQVRIDTLGSDLNAALAREAMLQKKRAERERLERYQSEFFRKMRGLLSNREGVQTAGDRFVLSSEILFDLGSAELSSAGRDQMERVARLLFEVGAEIPEGIEWVIRVDGHTDNLPIAPGAQYANNWELSQARALSVVRFMTEDLGFPPERLAPTGFGEFQPIATADTPQARAQNRRIELKLTER